MNKINPFKSFVHACILVLENINFLFRISWMWIALTVLLEVVRVMMFAGGNFTADIKDTMSSGHIVMLIITGVISLIGFSSIAVSFHRLVLLGEKEELIPTINIDWDVFRYAGNILLIYLASAVIALIGMVPLGLLSVALYYLTGGSKGAYVIMAIGAFLIFFHVMGMVSRIYVKLAGVALGRTDFSMKQAWNATAGNTVSLATQILMIAFVSIIIMFIFGLLTALLAVTLGLLGGIIGGVMFAIVYWLLIMLGISVITTNYGYFVEGRSLG